jgi:hypothetical protein
MFGWLLYLILSHSATVGNHLIVLYAQFVPTLRISFRIAHILEEIVPVESIVLQLSADYLE